MRQIVLDTETTGLRTEDGHRIIEIGCVELVNRKFTGNTYHQYINPQREIDQGAVAVHGITQEFLQDKPIFIDVTKSFMDFIKDAELIIHNAPFDVGFINYELGLTRQSWKPLNSYCQVIDTLLLARQMHVGQRNSLDALCKRYMIDNTHREFHGALLDAHLLAKVYLAMTGGQGSLFDEIASQEVAQEEKRMANPVERSLYQLKVIYADETELAAHEAKIKKMAEKGKCLFLTPES